MRPRPASVVGAVLAGTGVVLAGCGSDDPAPATPTALETPTATEETTAEASAVPDEVTVCEPGLIDTAMSPHDVPAWPGPRPVDFMEPAPPSGACGTLTGDEARLVWEAASDHPDALLEEDEEPGDATDALWSLDGVVVWLVVETVW